MLGCPREDQQMGGAVWPERMMRVMGRVPCLGGRCHQLDGNPRLGRSSVTNRSTCPHPRSFNVLYQIVILDFIKIILKIHPIYHRPPGVSETSVGILGALRYLLPAFGPDSCWIPSLCSVLLFSQ